MIKKTNKLPMQVILVSKGDQALPTGTFTTNSTSVNLADGQIGVMSFDKNSAVKTVGQYLASGDTSAEVAAIKVVQGTALSANTQLVNLFEVGDPTHVESGVINRSNIRSVMVKKPSYGVLGAQSATTFATPVNDAEYSAYIKLDSVRYDREYSTRNDVTIHAAVPRVNFTTAGIAQPLDYVLSKLMAEFNSQSKAVATNSNKGNKNFVVLGLKVAGGSGVALSTITPSTDITFQTINGQAQVLKSSSELCQTLARLIDDSALVNASTIENVDASTAGATAKIDALIVIGLPHQQAAYFDNMAELMVKPSFNFAGGFIAGADPVVVNCHPVEGFGHGWKWKLQEAQRPLVDKHTKQVQPKNDWFYEGVSYINKDHFYTSEIINYFDVEQTLTGTVVSPKELILLFRAEVPSTFTIDVANIVARTDNAIPFVTSDGAGTGTASANIVAGVEGVLNAWIEDARVNGTDITIGGDAVPGGTYLS